MRLLAGVTPDGVDGVLVEGALLLLGGAPEVAGVVHAVRHEVPVALHHGVSYFGVVVKDGDVEGGSAPDVVLVEELKEAPESDAVAVVHVGVAHDIGVWCARPGVLVGVVGRQVVVMLYVGSDPEGDAGVVGPFDDGPVYDRRVVEAVRLHGTLPR